MFLLTPLLLGNNFVTGTLHAGHYGNLHFCEDAICHKNVADCINICFDINTFHELIIYVSDFMSPFVYINSCDGLAGFRKQENYLFPWEIKRKLYQKVLSLCLKVLCFSGLYLRTDPAT